MIKITDVGIEVNKGDVFNLLTIPSEWDASGGYTCFVTGNNVNIEIPCSLFRKYVRLYLWKLDIPEGTYNFTIYKNGEAVLTDFIIVKGVSHNNV